MTKRRDILERKKVTSSALKKASSVKNHLAPFSHLQRYNRNGLFLFLESGQGNKLNAYLKKFIQDLLKANMEGLYGYDWSKEEKVKRREMVYVDAHYVFLYEAVNADLCKKPKKIVWGKVSCRSCRTPVGFVQYRFTIEEEIPVIYLYELQLCIHVRGKGLGEFLMQLIELIAFENGMSAVVLTVQKANELAMDFYTKKLGRVLYTLYTSETTWGMWKWRMSSRKILLMIRSFRKKQQVLTCLIIVSWKKIIVSYLSFSEIRPANPNCHPYGYVAALWKDHNRRHMRAASAQSGVWWRHRHRRAPVAASGCGPRTGVWEACFIIILNGTKYQQFLHPMLKTSTKFFAKHSIVRQNKHLSSIQAV